MDELSLYEHILSIRSPWFVEHVELLKSTDTVHVYIDYDRDTPLQCPQCEQTASRYDTRERCWRHLDTCQFHTLVHAAIPRVHCPSHGVLQIDVPWAEKNSRFTLLFEAWVIGWLKEASICAVSRGVKLSWNAIDGIMRRAVERGLSARGQAEVTHLAVDEVSSKKGHAYMTVISNDAGQVLDVVEGRSKESLSTYYRSLGTEGISSIKTVSMDMCQAYISSTKQHVKDWEEKICFDKFHIAMDLNQAVNEVRRQEMRDIPKEYRVALHRSRFSWLRSEASLKNRHREQLACLRRVATKTARAWAIRQYAMTLWDYRSRYWAQNAWLKWYGWAIRSRLISMKTAAVSIKKNLWGIINAIIYRQSNARAESINSRIKILKVRARGFRNKERFRTAILFHLGGLDLSPKAKLST